ncbi:MAG: ketoacyl-ACP synthase III [Peptococcaceae bacterium]|nr:ketoacyl-ACP synthase III [Peptococcaceae bacterium]
MQSRIRAGGVVGVGIALPERVVTNEELGKRLGVDEDWITSRSGVRERRIADPGQAASDFAVPAARQALAQAGVAPEEVDLIIFATNTPDNIVPIAGCTTQQKLGAVRAGAFDLIAGCSGSIYALAIAAQFIATGIYDTILVIGAEAMNTILDWEDRGTCVLFGDGAGALVMRPVPEGRGVLSFYLGAQGEEDPSIIIPAGGSRMPPTRETVEKRLHYVRMKGQEVFRFAVRAQDKVCQDVLDMAGLAAGDVDLFIPHQANLRIIEGAAKRLGIPMEKVLVTLDKFGNTSAASIPMALARAVSTGRLKTGDVVLLTGFGAGLTYAGMIMRW